MWDLLCQEVSSLHTSLPLGCLLNGHDRCDKDHLKIVSDHCRELWQFAHCKSCGFVLMVEPHEDGKERWEPVNG